MTVSLDADMFRAPVRVRPNFDVYSDAADESRSLLN